MHHCLEEHRAKLAADCLSVHPEQGGPAKQTRQSEYTSAGLQAWIYAGIGDREHTLESLEKDENQRGTTTLFLRDDAKLDFVRSEPRFIALLKKIHLDDN
jgi:hypothetical protein